MDGVWKYNSSPLCIAVINIDASNNWSNTNHKLSRVNISAAEANYELYIVFASSTKDSMFMANTVYCSYSHR